MSEDIKKFDAADAMKSVKEKIKDSFVSLIPDDQWNNMVKKEVEDYFKERPQGYSLSNRPVSDFHYDVRAVLSEEVKQRVKKYLEDNFRSVWHENGIPKCDEKVEEIITKNAGKILAEMIGGQLQSMLANAGYRA